jgi:hypothetical protein
LRPRSTRQRSELGFSIERVRSVDKKNIFFFFCFNVQIIFSSRDRRSLTIRVINDSHNCHLSRAAGLSHEKESNASAGCFKISYFSLATGTHFYRKCNLSTVRCEKEVHFISESARRTAGTVPIKINGCSSSQRIPSCCSPNLMKKFGFASLQSASAVL